MAIERCSPRSRHAARERGLEPVGTAIEGRSRGTIGSESPRDLRPQPITAPQGSAKLRVDACMEDLDFRRPRGLDRSSVLALASAQWVSARQNVLVVGPTGAKKTFLACALAHAAVRSGHTALYLRAPRLLDDLTVARGDGRLPRILAAWARVDVLVIDDLALRPLPPAAAADLLEVLEDRAGRRSTVVTSQLPIHDWHAALGDPSQPMPSSTGLPTTPTVSRCLASPCAARRPMTAPTAPNASAQPENEALLQP